MSYLLRLSLTAALLATACALPLQPGAVAAKSTAPKAAPAQPAASDTDFTGNGDLAACHLLHVRKRNAIAARLTHLWSEERDIIDERDRLGRMGEMGSVIQLERELLSVRQEIDRLRQELSRENRFLALLDERIDAKR